MNGKGIIRQLDLSSFTVMENVKGLTDAQALLSPPGGGNPLNWVLGHIVISRNMLLEAIGLDRVGDEALTRLYDRGTKPADAADAMPLQQLLDLYLSTRKPILRFLEEADDALFEKPLATPSDVLGDTVGSAVIALAWHEGYHAGQIGTLRRMAGLDGVIR